MGYFIILSGSEDANYRALLIRLFNSPENRYGNYIRIIMGTSAVAEGVGFKNVRQVHVMEPHWNEVRIDQVVSRARRLCSHRELTPDQRNFTVYRYYATLGFNEKERDILLRQISPFESLTTDEHIAEIAEFKNRINQQVLRLLKENAVDSRLNYRHNQSADPLDQFELPPFPDESRAPIYFPIPSLDEYDDRYEATTESFEIRVQEYHTRLTRLQGMSLVVRLNAQEVPDSMPIRVPNHSRYGSLANQEVEAIPVYDRTNLTHVLVYHIPALPQYSPHLREIYARNVT